MLILFLNHRNILRNQRKGKGLDGHPINRIPRSPFLRSPGFFPVLPCDHSFHNPYMPLLFFSKYNLWISSCAACKKTLEPAASFSPSGGAGVLGLTGREIWLPLRARIWDGGVEDYKDPVKNSKIELTGGNRTINIRNHSVTQT